MAPPELRAGAAALLVSAGLACATGGPSDGLDEMYVHFGRVGEAQTAVIQGRMERAREAARRIASAGAVEAPSPEGEAMERRLRQAAARTAGAEGSGEVAEGTAAMGAACGSCHVTVGGGPVFSPNLPPIQPSAGAPERAQRMLRHAWAADRMWEGLIGPSDQRWRAGAEALVDLPPEIAGIPSRQDTGGWSRLLPALGEQALEASDQDGRAEVYGSLLETCGSCHEALGVSAGGTRR